jgi:hypothetical protein
LFYDKAFSLLSSSISPHLLSIFILSLLHFISLQSLQSISSTCFLYWSFIECPYLDAHKLILLYMLNICSYISQFNKKPSDTTVHFNLFIATLLFTLHVLADFFHLQGCWTKYFRAIKNCTYHVWITIKYKKLMIFESRCQSGT